MGRRLDLQYKLEEILGNTNVYYNPPPTKSRNYPAIEYVRDDVDSKYADNNAYCKTNRYKITVIDSSVDNPAIDKLLDLPMCSYDRPYTIDGLHHDVLLLYY